MCGLDDCLSSQPDSLCPFAERAELARLSREKQVVEMEVEIFKRTSAYFAGGNVPQTEQVSTLCSRCPAEDNRAQAIGATVNDAHFC